MIASTFYSSFRKRIDTYFSLTLLKKMNGLVSLAATTGIMLLLTLIANHFWPVKTAA